ISRQYAASMLNEACDMVGIKERFGTHGLRKTWAFFAFKKGISLDYISIALNHNSIAETKRYIGLLQEDLDNTTNKFLIMNRLIQYLKINGSNLVTFISINSKPE
ncbi:tyrosine-type recombinase/integrase, partial [Caldibacillus thermoamylovorans]